MNIPNPKIQKRAREKGLRCHLISKNHGSSDLVIRISRIVKLMMEVIFQNFAKMKSDFCLLLPKAAIPNHKRQRL